MAKTNLQKIIKRFFSPDKTKKRRIIVGATCYVTDILNHHALQTFPINYTVWNKSIQLIQNNLS